MATDHAGLSAKQIAYTLTQVPLVYFHVMGVCLHSFIMCLSWQSAHGFAAAGATQCTPSAANAHDGRCYAGYGAMLVLGQVWLIYLLVGLYMSAVWMSDPMGTRAANYDLGVDLAGLWAESQNAIDAMLQARSSLHGGAGAGGGGGGILGIPAIPAVRATADGFVLDNFNAGKNGRGGSGTGTSATATAGVGVELLVGATDGDGRVPGSAS